jgi:hypothetical protein
LMIALALPTAVLADSPTLLGGLTLREYCVAHGYTDVALVRSPFGPNAAFNNWRCVSADGGLHRFSMVRACQWQYELNQVHAHPLDRNNALTWYCYSVRR